MTFDEFARAFDVVTSVGAKRPELKGNYFLLEQVGEQWEVSASAVELFILRELPRQPFKSRDEAINFIAPLARMHQIYRVYVHLEAGASRLAAMFE